MRDQTPATDLRCALEDLRNRPGELIQASPEIRLDEAAANFAAAFAGPPAAARAAGEPAVFYPLGSASLPLLLGTYGDEDRIRRWLPGLPSRIAPETVGDLRGTQFRPIGSSDLERDILPPDLDLLPIPRVTPRDAGRYITMGFALALDPLSGEPALSAHRMLVLGPDRLGLWMLPSRRLRRLREQAAARGEALPITINIGAPPAAVIAAATGADGLPTDLDKLTLAGNLAGRPLHLAAAPSGAAMLAASEIVIDGLLTPENVDETASEDAVTMPEFLGYDGRGQARLAVMRITSIGIRPGASFQATIGPGREQSAILGIGGALSLALAEREEQDGLAIHDLRFSHAGGGMLLLFAALRKETDLPLEPLARQLIEASPFTKLIIFVDCDVSVRSEEDVLWAMTTRAQLANDLQALSGFSTLAMDPSQSGRWQAETGSPALKSVIDATLPAHLSTQFSRSFA